MIVSSSKREMRPIALSGGVARLARFAERIAPIWKQTLRVSGGPPDTTEEGAVPACSPDVEQTPSPASPSLGLPLP
jgi:hypothetical protein